MITHTQVKVKLVFFILNIFIINKIVAQKTSDIQHFLVVMAHPDDESTFSATLYKIAREQHGIVDILTITNGGGGFKYSTLAETYYNIQLTNEKTGRENLPRIRKRELMNAGNILGINQYYFLDQTDAHYGINELEPLDTSWYVPVVKKKISQLLINNHYDFVFCLLPEPSAHSGHKAATLLALDVISELPAKNRPIILGGMTHNKNETPFKFSQYANYKNSETLTDTCMFRLDRTTQFGYKNRLNYKMIVNWEICEHKSQGVMQMAVNDGDDEQFWYFAINGKSGIEKTKTLFNLLKIAPYTAKTY